MSWDSYIDNLMGHCNGNCDMACIIGLDGSKWTTDAHASAYKLSATEAANIARAMNDGMNMTTFQSNGIIAAGIKYQFLRGEENLVLGKKKEHGGITLQKSKTAIVIGHTKEGGTHGNTNKGVGVIAEYLENLGM